MSSISSIAIDIIKKYSEGEGVEKIDYDLIVHAYATYLICMMSMHDTYEAILGELHKCSFTQPFREKVAWKYYINFDELDEDFHQVHLEYPSVRMDALKKISEARNASIEVITTISVSGRHVEKFISEVENFLSNYDCHVEFWKINMSGHMGFACGDEEVLAFSIYTLDRRQAEKIERMINKSFTPLERVVLY